jgi:2-C-methyl-D-erythritol 4-phosphate cytidylyltransferase
MNYSALIVAAGQGKRMGLGYNKVLYQLSDECTVLQQVIKVFFDDPRCKQIIVVMNKEDIANCAKQQESGKIVHVKGGTTRQESVFNGLGAVSEDYVLIHDGARPFLTHKCIDDLLSALESEKACLLAVRVKDTIKVVENGYIKETLYRDNLIQAQTPQAFETNFIINCYKEGKKQGLTFTDDAQIVELVSDVKIKVVEGDYRNFKITTIEDLK